ncbi:MAG: hypothetical protein V4671_16820 [Armatimonadota bacterium]
MNQDQLDQAAAIVRRVTIHSGAAQGLAVNAHRLEGETLRSTLAEVTEQARSANEASQNLFRLLTSMGAKLPGKAGMVGFVPLHMLSTDAGRTLLAALETATKAAEAVDRERGWVDEDGEPIGYAETLQMIALKVRQDVEAPKGRD